MKQDGFTLIELVGTVVILAVISLIAFPALMGMLSSGQDKVDSSVKSVIESAALEYVNDNIDDNITSVDICTLVKNGYVSTTFYKKNKDSIDGSSVNVGNNKYEYQEGGGGKNCLEVD